MVRVISALCRRLPNRTKDAGKPIGRQGLRHSSLNGRHELEQERLKKRDKEEKAIINYIFLGRGY